MPRERRGTPARIHIMKVTRRIRGSLRPPLEQIVEARDQTCLPSIGRSDDGDHARISGTQDRIRFLDVERSTRRQGYAPAAFFSALSDSLRTPPEVRALFPFEPLDALPRLRDAARRIRTYDRS